MLDPLHLYPAVRTCDPYEAEDGIVRAYGARRLNLPRTGGPLNVCANHWESNAIALSYCSYGAAVSVEFPEAKFFRLQLPISGAADIKIGKMHSLISSKVTCVIPPGAILVNGFPEGYRQLVFRVDRHATIRKLSALVGSAITRPVEFEPATTTDRLAGLQRLLHFLVEELGAPDRVPDLVTAELENALIVSLLVNARNNYSSLIEKNYPGEASWRVQRAEEYIQAHWSEPISIEVLAEVTSTSARNLFHHFKRTRGQSPMDVVKQVRLEHAKRKLEKADERTTVSQTAFECGFGNLGHFARDYLHHFGERPSETLRSGRKRSRLRTRLE